MKKLLAFVLTAVMVLAMAVPAFAEGHKTPEVVIANENADGYYVSGSTVKYEFTIHCANASIIKVGSKTLKMSDFKDNKDGSYTYKGTVNIGLTDTSLKFYVYDLGQGHSATWEETVKFKVDPTAPKLNVSAVKTGSAFNVGLISIIVTDNIGIEKIAVNGKTIADAEDIANKKAFITNYSVPAAGKYVVTATDTAGNVSITSVTFNADGSTNTESVTTPIGGNLWNGGYMSGLASIYKDNPQLYYYLKMLQNNGEINEDTWMLWYLLNQQNPSVPEGGNSANTNTNNWYLIYNYLLKNENIDIDKSLLYYYLANGTLGNLDLSIPDANFYWYLYQADDLGIDKTLLYYYLANGNLGELPLPDLKDNYLAYEYFFGSIFGFKDDASIDDFTKDGKLILTAPAVKDNVKVTYTWKTLTSGSWKTIGSNSDTLIVDPVVGAKYKVEISSEFYFNTVTSDVLTVTDDMKVNDTDPVIPDDDDDEDDASDFTAEDITINGVKNNIIKLKVGQKAYLVPNYNGYWVFDTNMFEGVGSSLIVLTPKKAGNTVIAFTALNSDGDSATKQVLVVVEE